MRNFVLVMAIVALFLPSITTATVGVGVGTGKITIEQALKGGGIYNIPSLIVFNTGDETSDYGVSLMYENGQPELRPELDWFSFEPAQTNLEPTKGEEIKIKLTLPIRTEPGKYFAYLTAKPISTTTSNGGGAVIGVAAAAKLSFTVEPANWFQGMFFRMMNLIRIYKTWIYVFLGIVVTVVVILAIRKFVHIEIGMKKKN